MTTRLFELFRAAVAAVAIVLPAATCAEEAPRRLPPPLADEGPREALETAVLAGGCFWGVEGVFQHVKGVRRVLSGYSGGDAPTSYEAVGTGRTGHAESVEILFDPKAISYGTILQIFFSVAHDPTQLNRQGPDFGPQYRSNIFAGDAEQRKIAEAYIAQLTQAKAFGRPIVTRVDPLKKFYKAEDYHQDYLTKHPHQPYIVINDLPKIAALKKLFPELYLEKPVLDAAM